MSGLAVKTLNVSTISLPENIKQSDYCTCDFWCEWEEIVFAYSSGTDTWKKDFSDFLVQKVTASDTVTIELYRYDVLVATITNSTYGTYYPSFTAQPLYVGWVADWTAIYNDFSGGQYQVKITGTIAGSSYSFESRKFRLSLWNEEAADTTVKIESYQTGNIMSSPFDYTDLIDGGWYSSIRVPGRFGNRTPSLEVDEVLDTGYKSIQNRTQVTHEYTLTSRYFSNEVIQALADQYFIGNELYITDYSLMSYDKYNRIPVVASAYEEIVHNNYNGEARFSITFTDRTPNTIKRNF